MSKHEVTEKDWLATLERALKTIRESKQSGGGTVTVHHDGTVTEDRWTATLTEGPRDGEA